MSLLLNIDTALELASVSLAIKGEVLQTASNDKQKDHALWLHPAIAALLQKSEQHLHDVQAVAVSIGPGSYTGLRVGLAAAKGFCFALNIPLVTIGTLEIIAFAVKKEAAELICPLIDARRMEVYTAVYDKEIVEKIPPHVTVLQKNSFGKLLASHKILFCGSGSKKLQAILSDSHAVFTNTPLTIYSLSELSYNYFRNKDFADLAYTEPLYIKDFYTATRKD